MKFTTDPWIPVFQNGRTRHVTLDAALDLPISQIEARRPDFNFALKLALIGLEQTGFEPFPLLGDGERFLQDARARRGRQKPIDTLFLDEPGENTIKKNADLFVRARQRGALCLPCSTIALYTFSQFRGPGGAGNYPAPLFHSTLYLKSASTLRQLIAANLIDSNVPAAAYFTTANPIWLDSPIEGRCAHCDTHGPVIKSYWQASGHPTSVENPHCATTAKGRRYAIGPQQTRLDIIDGAAPNSVKAIPPKAISDNATVGDEIIAFGTYYNKATLSQPIYSVFRLQNRVNYELFDHCVWATLAAQSTRKARPNMDSQLAAEIRDTLADLIGNGWLPEDAVMHVFDTHLPQLDTLREHVFSARRHLQSQARKLKKDLDDEWRTANGALLVASSGGA